MVKKKKISSPLFYSWQRFTANRIAYVSFVLLSLIILAGIFAPLITPAHYAEQAYRQEVGAFPSWQHLFGVDNVGRDLFSRIIYGIRVSLGIGFISSCISLLVGIPLGALAGIKEGRVDWFIMRICEIFSVIPPLLVGMLLANIVDMNMWTIIVIAALFGWVGIFRMVRGQVLAVKNKVFVTSARALGATFGQIMTWHIIPNSISPIIVGFVLAVPQAMMFEASMSFLGIGINPPTPSWGQMINEGLYYMFFYWHLALFPTLALAITILVTSIVGDGLRDAIDPTSGSNS
jgi:ABC-type dipeptide/oligopeptide/nickel transport system permease subunit